MNRRQFLKQSVGTAAALSLFSGPRVLGANERIVIGFMGVGGRGTALLEKFASREDVSIAYLADADSRRFGPASKVVEKAKGRAPQTVQDFRRVLDDKTVEVLVNATPDHWHGLGTILACQAGKDVYVEKPMSHNIYEGRKMVEAARKYKRVVTVGMQSRSAPYLRKAIDYIRSGQIGDIHLVRVFNMMQHSPSKVASHGPPAEIDYDLWSGPAEKLANFPGGAWLNLFEFSCGAIPGDAIHQLDLARMLMGDPPAPKMVVATSGIRVLRDGRDTPDTQFALFDYEGFTLQFDGALWTPYLKKTPGELRDKDLTPNWPFNSTRIEVLGTRGFMYVGRHGDGWQLYDENAKLVENNTGRQGDPQHIENFLSCVRSRQKPNADVEQGHQSALLCHLANIGWRAATPALKFDGQNETCIEPTEANRFIKRKYRSPWLVPEQV